MTLREVIDRLEDFADDETIYVESMTATARAVVAAEPDDGSVPRVATGLVYLLEVAVAREAIEVWTSWRQGQEPTLDDKLAAVTYYAQNDAWLPIEQQSSSHIPGRWPTDDRQPRVSRWSRGEARYGSVDDLLRLSEIRSANWDERRSIQAGESAGARAYWASVGDHAALMIGRDDETWDVSLTVPFGVIEEVVREVRRYR